MRRSGKFGLGLVGLGVAACILISIWARSAPHPVTLGVRDGRLTACPSTPNCVATEGGASEQAMSPLPYSESLGEAKARLLAVIRAMPRTTIVAEEAEYIAAEFRTVGIGFTDDVEFRFDEAAKVIHFRSASRLGRDDLGVNRARMEALSLAFSEVTP